MASPRSEAGRWVTRSPSIWTSPLVTFSSPAMTRSSVDFPQPGRADEDDEFAVLHREIDAVQHVDAAEGFA